MQPSPSRAHKHLRILLGHIGGIGIVLFVLLTLHGRGVPLCPLRWILDAGCPFCGMTRAHLAALSLDFKAAFAAHPLFPGAIPFLWVLSHDGLLHGRPAQVLRWVFIALFCMALAAVYLLRITGHIPMPL